jgi:hypothetical protein
MPHALAVSRVTVPPPAQAEYLELLGRLARLSEGRGRHVWLFRMPGRPDAFLECNESRTRELHRAVGGTSEDEMRLEARLRELVSYPPDAWELWEEVAL